LVPDLLVQIYFFGESGAAEKARPLLGSRAIHTVVMARD
jgi:hypothetical protein